MAIHWRLMLSYGWEYNLFLFSAWAADGEIGGGRARMLASAHLLESHMGNEPEAISHSN